MKETLKRHYISISLILLALVVILIPLLGKRFELMPIPKAAEIPAEPSVPNIQIKSIPPQTWKEPSVKNLELPDVSALHLKTTLARKALPKVNTYVIHLISKNPAKLISNLQAQGLPAYQNPEVTDQTTIWVGPFTDDRDARAALAKIQNQFNLQGNLENYSPFK